ncbi:hypothetical protein C5167_050651 [Papaver somniferum]|uniref:Bulb-type lectin domain-containing protein n=1 Tax=Papaver somniferum TaxID=3469 RepID=A0A4Y7KS22_PAPSO|nr:EP1-like glycoprotein 4 [Papaver somniferum]RZC75160.1 hypothetical protein C5167_050651 [Papaver somniferum]
MTKFLFLFLFFILCSSSILASAVVPVSKTFNIVNRGALLSGIVEFNAEFRQLRFANYPFRLCFYKPFLADTYILAIGLGNGGNTRIRWVWAANLNHPVGNNANLVFNSTGNLALIDTDGRVAWQTSTANKGVVDIKLLPNGNFVLVNKNGEFVWQSFNHPTNTLLVGQALIPGSSSTNKLVNGAYSLVLQGKQLGLFFNPISKSSSSNPLNYFNLIDPVLQSSVLKSVTFNIAPDSFGAESANELGLYTSPSTRFILAQPKYNSTLSIFRLGADGNAYIYTYFEKSNERDAWEETYATFSKNGTNEECLMPEKCGSFGLCSNNQCVACPTPKGLTGWNKECKPSSLPSRGASAAKVGYYKLEGVDRFMSAASTEAEGPMKVDACMKKCSDDCKCAGFFYRVDSSMCLRTSQFYTLMKLSDDLGSNKLSTVYIKYAK